MAYAWIVTKDHVTEPGEKSRVGTVGPRRAPEALLATLEDGEGERWKTWDDDGNPAYEGKIVGEYDGFEPLDDFATPDAGATRIAYWSPGAGGGWRDL